MAFGVERRLGERLLGDTLPGALLFEPSLIKKQKKERKYLRKLKGQKKDL
jgi:hypothetical protein